jgi:L-fuconolactonase
MRIDAHQHFWNYEAVKHSWINDEMAAIRKDFSPADLAPVLQQNKMDGCVAVQADQTENETDFLIALQAKNDFIKGVVGWVDLRAENIIERLAHYAKFNCVKGFRHVLQHEEPDFMLQSDFVRGIAALQQFGFTYDILIFPNHLKAALQLVKQFPNINFVIDHIAKPYIKKGEIETWATDMCTIAEYKNVYCKISGMVTEADFKYWKKEDFTAYINVMITAFGTERILFGSDWPVCLSAAAYHEVVEIVDDYFKSFTKEEQAGFWGKNAEIFYNL